MNQSFKLSVLTICFLVGEVAYGQSTTVPDDAKFVVQIDVSEFRATELGGRLLALTKRMAAAELGGDEGEIMQRVEETLGFNPLEEVQSLTVIGRSFENAEEDLQVVLRLRQTTGNLEGLMLALPNYNSSEVGEYTIHSASNGDMTAYAGVHSAGDGSKTIVSANKLSDVATLLEALDAGSSADIKHRAAGFAIPEGTFVQIQLIQLPDELMRNEQASNISKLLKDIAITAREDGEDLAASLVLTTSDEKRAEQIQQLVQGLKAMVGLLKDEIGDDEEAQMALSIAEKITVQRDGATVVVETSIPQASIIEFLREEADLPL